MLLFWNGHNDFSERFALDDPTTRRVSITLVFLVLVFVYPLRLVFSSFFSWISGGVLTSGVSFQSVEEFRALFVVFALAFGSMATALVWLYWHAGRAGVDLDVIERQARHYQLRVWGIIVVFCGLSLTLALTVPIGSNDLVTASPGIICFGLNGIQYALQRRWRRKLARLTAADSSMVAPCSAAE